jgi:hypothetical protein
LPPPFGRGNNKTPWPPWPSTTKYLTSNDGWTTIKTWCCSRRVSDPRGTSLTMRPGYRALLSQRGMETTSKRIGSNNWPKGKWQGSPESTFRGKPHLSQRCMLPQLWGKKMSWDPFMLCQDGSGRYSQDPPPTMACCSSTSKLLTIGEWSERSFNSDNSNTIYRTSASESPITRLNSKECHRLKPH